MVGHRCACALVRQADMQTPSYRCKDEAGRSWCHLALRAFNVLGNYPMHSSCAPYAVLEAWLSNGSYASGFSGLRVYPAAHEGLSTGPEGYVSAPVALCGLPGRVLFSIKALYIQLQVVYT